MARKHQLTTVDPAGVSAAIITSLKAARLAPRCSGCGRLVLEEGGYDRVFGLSFCWRCALTLDAGRHPGVAA